MIDSSNTMDELCYGITCILESLNDVKVSLQLVYVILEDEFKSFHSSRSPGLDTIYLFLLR